MDGRIGVLALQGDFGAHARALGLAGADAREVRRPRDLLGIAGLVVPGGESTALLKLLEPERMDDAIVEFHRDGGWLLGTCAGLILLAKEVEAPSQRALGLLDCVVVRNAYGRQVDSFVAPGLVRLGDRPEEEVEMVFIRAPRIRSIGAEVEVLGRLGEEPVLVRQGRIAAATFHPELSPRSRIHSWFAQMAGATTEGGDAAPLGS